MSGQPTIRAAGGVVRRRGDAGDWQILLVHRPRYGDWSFPKGKADEGEPDDATALREVEEETGLRCSLGPEVGRTRYRDSKGRPKVVRYWLMAPLADRGFTPNPEVDELRWCSCADARNLLTYAHDRELLSVLDGVNEGGKA